MAAVGVRVNLMTYPDHGIGPTTTHVVHVNMCRLNLFAEDGWY